jgi:hypothetical protein
MSSNYQKSAGTFGGLIGQNSYYPPVPNSDDAKLLNQQQTYAALCDTFIANLGVVRGADGLDLTKQAQKFYLAIVQNTLMTLAAAQAYFPNVSTPASMPSGSSYWATSGIIDYKAAYTAITTTNFPG